MSFNPNDTINLSNYEEWFVLYMDNELGAGEKASVEAFLLLHPHLQEELDLLLSTKLPLDDIAFVGKESLKADSMKLGVVDESLLLYLDNELSAAERKTVEEKIAAKNNVRLQYNVLKETKLDASEVVPYPNKKELYRHSEKVVFFPVWVRVAVAVILILSATFFFIANKANTVAPTIDVVKKDEPIKEQNSLRKKENTPVVNTPAVLQQSTASVRLKKQDKKINVAKVKTSNVLPQTQSPQQEDVAVAQPVERKQLPQIEPVKIDVKKLTADPIAINISTAKSPVTSLKLDSLKQEEVPEVTADNNREFKTKKGSARGLLRKVSRFISHRTGIGIASSDNETLVGMVALKLN